MEFADLGRGKLAAASERGELHLEDRWKANFGPQNEILLGYSSLCILARRCLEVSLDRFDLSPSILLRSAGACRQCGRVAGSPNQSTLASLPGHLARR